MREWCEMGICNKTVNPDYWVEGKKCSSWRNSWCSSWNAVKSRVVTVVAVKGKVLIIFTLKKYKIWKKHKKSKNIVV